MAHFAECDGSHCGTAISSISSRVRTLPAMCDTRTSRKSQARISATAVILAALSFAFLFLENAEPAHSQIKRRPDRSVAVRYREFPHDVKAHRKECSSCHTLPSPNWKTVPPVADAIPDITEYPKHESCIGCHMPQFFRGARPAICSICHVNPSPRDSRRHPFPNPREIFDVSPKGRTATSDFQVTFPHATHLDLVSNLARERTPFVYAGYSRTRRAEESCAVCHKTKDPQGENSDEYLTKPPADLGEGFWLKKGTFKTKPNGHTTCFTCHSADTGISPAPTACASCHSLRIPAPAQDFDAKHAARMKISEKAVLDSWRMRDSSGKFRHEWFSHAELSCATCHSAEKINSLDPATKKVPIAACSTCHATATSDDGGALNYEADARKKDPKFECTKCHLTFGKLAIPPTHIKALTEAGAKQ